MQEWDDIQKQDVRFDPLLDALIRLTQLYGKPYTRDALSAGLPIEDGVLDAKSFPVAAERAGLTARLLKRPLEKVSALTLPALLLLKGKQTAILLDVNHEAQVAKIMRPEFGDAEEEVSLESLNEEFTGYLYLLKKRHRFEGRQEETLNLKVRHWFWGVMAQSWKIYRDVLIASIVINLLVLAAPLYSRNVYDRVIPNGAFDTLWTFTIGILIAYTFDFILRMVRAYFLDIAGKKSDVMLNSIIFEKVQAMELAARPKSIGTFSKQLTDFESIRDLITSSSMALLIDMPFTIIFLIFIFIMGGPIVLVPLTAGIIILLFGWYAHVSMKYTVEQTYRASGEKSGLLIETLNNPESVKAYNMQSRNQKKWEDATGEIAGWSIKTKLMGTAVGSFSNYIQQLATVGTILFGVYLIDDAKLTMGGLIAVSMLLGRTISPMAQMASLITRIHGAKASFESLEKMMQSPVEIDKEKSYIQKNNFQGNFEFKGVDFAYPEAEVLSLHDASFTIKPGQKLGILGRIGSGKSTIGKLLMRYYMPSEGSVYVDGIDINQISPYELRSHIGYVPQHVQLFFGTVKENIMMGASFVDDARVQMVAKLAGVTEFTDRHPMGLDMPVGEGGVNLSGGQRQLVALARALLLFPKVLILDEPSSGMDYTTERILRDKLKGIIQDRTVIIATHRPSLLELVDTLMVVEAGQIAAYGDKEQVTQQLQGTGGVA
jgi:ATP-binding cassette, subfamily C, bacterial LapB